MTDKLIEFNDVWEQYQVKFIVNRKVSWEKIWALRGVSFDVAAGEAVCIIGENGSGKSTTLKIIAGMLKPDCGNVNIRGTVSALLELGAGFHPELTGRDNVYLNAAMFGLSKERIDEVFGTIVEFSGLGRFIDAIVKSYSQGMFVRLAFSLAIHIDPDILLIDDTLAVGDEDFQKKCVKKIFELKERGKTIVLVSHDLNTIAKLCNRGLILRDGQLLQCGPIRRIVSSYLETVGSKQGIALLQQQHLRVVFNNGRLILNWKGLSFTKHLGGYSSFFYEGRNHLSSEHEWNVEYVDGRRIVARGKNLHFGLEQVWTITLTEDLSLKWDIDVQAPEEAMQEIDLHVDLMLSDEYRQWIGLKGEGAFPEQFSHETNWYDVDDFAACGDLLGVRSARGHLEELPGLLIDMLNSSQKRLVRAFNTGFNIKARALQTVSIGHEEVLGYGDCCKRFFEGTLRVFEFGDDHLMEYIERQRQARSCELDVMRLTADQGRVGLYYKGIELTASAGFFTSFLTRGRWYDSTQALWHIERRAEGFSIDLRWADLPVTQRWIIDILTHARILWRIEMHTDQELHVQEEKAAVMVSSTYRAWVNGDNDKGVFPDIIGWQDMPLHDMRTRYVGAACFEEEPEDTKTLYPPVFLGFSKNHDTFTPQIQNSSQELLARVLQARSVWPEGHVYTAGGHELFSGVVDVGAMCEETPDEMLPEARPQVMIKKVLLVNMPWRMGRFWGVRAGSRWPHIKEEVEGDYLPFPFYLAYAAAVLREQGYEVEVIDAIAEQISLETFLNQVYAAEPDLVVAEVATATLQHDLDILERLGTSFKKAICGADVIMRDEAFLSEHPEVDYIFVGEYEHTVRDLAAALNAGKDMRTVPGLIFRDQSGKIITTATRPLADVDQLPWPLRDIFPMDTYLDAPGEMPTPSVQMWASRGCPYQCIFCAWPAIMYGGGTYRARNMIDVVDEMEYLVNRRGFKSVYFDDDTFNIGKERMLTFCRELKRRYKEGRMQKVPWAIMARADCMDEEILTEMKSAGLHAVKYGVESASQALVDNAHKKMDVKKTIAMIRLTKAMGIKVHLTFTFGLPDETHETIQHTIDTALRLDPDSIQFSITTPFPGTPYYADLMAQGRITATDWSDYDGNYKSVFSSDNLTSEELVEAQDRAYRVWEEHCCRRKQLTGARSPVRQFFVYAKLCGMGFAVHKIGSYAGFRARKFIEDRRERKGVELVRKSLKIKAFPSGKVKLFWRGLEVTKDIGLTSSVRVLDQWYDATKAVWKITHQPRSVAITIRFKDVPITQHWWLEAFQPHTINWEVFMEVEEELAVQEEKIGMMISDQYVQWFHGDEQGMFPKIHDWEEVGLTRPEIQAITVSENGQRSIRPMIEFNFAQHGDRAIVQAQNTDKARGAHLIQSQKIWGSGGRVYEQGRYKFFSGRIILDETGEKGSTDEVSETPYACSLGEVFATAVHKYGLFGTIKKVLKRMHPKALKDSYTQMLGVYDGAYAYKGPDFLQIDPTNNCNNRCACCWCHSDLLGDQKMPAEVKKQTLPYDLLCSVVDEVHAMGTTHVYFAGGGEPFMHPRLLDVVERVKERGMLCSLNTSFHLVDEEKVRRIVDLDVDYMTISVWAGSAKTYVATHPDKSEEDFCRLREHLIQLNNEKKDKKPYIKLYNVISSLNYDDLEAMVNFAVATKSESIEFTVVDVMPGKTEHLVPQGEQVEVLIGQAKKIKKRIDRGDFAGKLNFIGFEQFLRRISSSHASDAQYDKETIDALPRCYIGWVFARVLADGNINSCLKSHRIPIGNIYEQSFREIWNSAPQQVFREHTLCFAKDDPFFSLIGNDPAVKMGCYKSCDDLMRNAHAHQRFISLLPPERWVLSMMARWRKMSRSRDRKKYVHEQQEKEQVLCQWLNDR